MKKLFTISITIILMFVANVASANISLPDGMVIADRQDSGTGGIQWFGESVTTLTIDAQNVPGVKVSGKIKDCFKAVT